RRWQAGRRGPGPAGDRGLSRQEMGRASGKHGKLSPRRSPRMNKAPTRRSINAALALGALALPRLGIGAARAQTQPAKLALIAPLSGPWARQGQLVRLGAEMARDEI